MHNNKRVGSTTALKTFSLVSRLIPFRPQTLMPSLPNATLAFAVLAVILIINVHCSGESAFKRDKFINNLEVFVPLQ